MSSDELLEAVELNADMAYNLICGPEVDLDTAENWLHLAKSDLERVEEQGPEYSKLKKYLNYLELLIAFKNRGVDHLHYMAPLPTMVLIAYFGILSYNLRKSLEKGGLADSFREMGSTSIADPFVQCRREGKMIGDRPLHDYVPLYFGTHTPMQYVVTRESFHEQGLNIVFAEVDIRDVVETEGVWFTDGNAASSDTMFYQRPVSVAKVDWNTVLRVKDCWTAKYKRIKCAEALVPDRIEPGDIRRIVCMNTAVADKLNRLIESARELDIPYSVNPEIVSNRSHFYRMKDGKLIPND